MKYLYCVFTNYQLMGCINLNNKSNSDLILLGNADFDINLVNKANNVFRNVYTIKEFENEKVDKYFTKFKYYMLILKSIKNVIRFRGYNEIYLYNIHNPICAALLIINYKAEINLIDDGIGSYLTEEKSCKVMLNRKFSNSYLNFVDLITYETNTNIIPIKNKIKINTENVSNKVIFLEQPLYEIGINSLDLLNNIEDKEDIIIRKHPRSKNCYEGYINDVNNGSWEIICANYSDNIFITFHSTAAITPYLLHKNNNYIILMYKLSNYSDHDFDKLDKLFIKFREMNSDYVFIPKSTSELNQILKFLRGKINE